MGLFGLWLLYYLRQWCSYKLEGVQSDANRALYAASMDAKPKPRFPIFSYIVSCFVTVKGVEVDFMPIKTEDTVRVPKRAKDERSNASSSNEYVEGNVYSGVGAYMDGPAANRDLEANLYDSDAQGSQILSRIDGSPGCKTRQSPSKNSQDRNSESTFSSISSHLSSAVDVTLSEESSYLSDPVYSASSGSIYDASSNYNDSGNESDVVLSEESADNSDASSRQSRDSAYPAVDESTIDGQCGQHSYIVSPGSDDPSL